jgi:hypothetical protein
MPVDGADEERGELAKVITPKIKWNVIVYHFFLKNSQKKLWPAMKCGEQCRQIILQSTKSH